MRKYICFQATCTALQRHFINFIRIFGKIFFISPIFIVNFTTFLAHKRQLFSCLAEMHFKAMQRQISVESCFWSDFGKVNVVSIWQFYTACSTIVQNSIYNIISYSLYWNCCTIPPLVGKIGKLHQYTAVCRQNRGNSLIP